MKKIIIGILAIILISVVVFFYLRIAEDEEYKEAGSLLVEKVEKYKLENGKLPETVSELHLKSEMGEGPYYEKIDSLKYIVYFNIGFDDMFMYNSETNIWKETP
jgi:hypothetical protein